MQPDQNSDLKELEDEARLFELVSEKRRAVDQSLLTVVERSGSLDDWRLARESVKAD